MEEIEGSLGCKDSDGYAFIAGAAVAGGIFGLGAGALIGGYAAAVYWLIKCK